MRVINNFTPVNLSKAQTKIGKVLAQQLQPYDARAKKILEGFISSDVFDSINTVPKTRFENGFAYENDLPFQAETAKLIVKGIINNNSFVMSDTGHDIPVYAEILKHIQMPGGFYLPKFLDEANERRIGSQAQTWGAEIYQKQSSLNRATGLFAGLECHRESPLDSKRLPTLLQLKQLNIKNVVYLSEHDPDALLTFKDAKPDLRSYLDELTRNGIDVIFKGIDFRRKYM